jgi:hypothetical protein
MRLKLIVRGGSKLDSSSPFTLMENMVSGLKGCVAYVANRVTLDTSSYEVIFDMEGFIKNSTNEV